MHVCLYGDECMASGFDKRKCCDIGYPSSKQIQNLATALLSELVQQEIQNGSYDFSRIHLNASAVGFHTLSCWEV